LGTQCRIEVDNGWFEVDTYVDNLTLVGLLGRNLDGLKITTSL